MNTNLNKLIGKEVVIFPGNTDTKAGIIVDILDFGVLFKITSVKGRNGKGKFSQILDKEYRIGQLHFISYAAGLSFRTLTEEDYKLI